MHFIKQKSQQDNGLAAIENLFLLLHLKSTSLSTGKVKSYHDYPSLSSLSDFLNTFYVENLAVSIGTQNLKEIPYPAIAHLKQNNGHFVVLKNLQNGHIKYIDPAAGWIEEPVETFERKWSGTTLLVSTSERSGDPNYNSNKRIELANKFKTGTVYAIIAAIALFTLSQAQNNGFRLTWYLLFSLKLFGFLISFLINSLSKQSTANWYNSICSISRNVNCNKVFNSDAGKLLGTSMAVWGVLYFSAGLLVLVISAFKSERISIPLLGITIAALPYSLFSVYYQWRSVKAWCPLCLAVMITLWLELIVQWNLFSELADIRNVEAEMAAILFASPFALWFLFERKVEESRKVPVLEKSLDSFRKNKTLFLAALEAQSTIDCPNFTNSIILGNLEAPNTLVIVTNPNCPVCESTHKLIESLIANSAGQLNANIIFAGIKPGNSEHVAKLVIELSLKGDQALVSKALHQWFNKRDKSSLKGWIENYSAIVSKAADEVLHQHNEWYKKVGVDSTPTIFINKKRLMPEYNATDLEYHLRHLIVP